MEMIPDEGLPEHEHQEQMEYMPDWWIVFADTSLMFAHHTAQEIDDAFERQKLEGGKLKRNAVGRLEAMHLWMDAAIEFYERFGRDYERDEYRVDRPNYYDQHQFYLSTLTELLVLTYHSEEPETRHEWRDNEAYIVVTVED